MDRLMKRIGLPLFVIVLVAATPAFGQLPQNPNTSGTATQKLPSRPGAANYGFLNTGNITFASPVSAVVEEFSTREVTNIAFASGDSAPPRPASNDVPIAGTAAVPIPPERPVTQNATNTITQNHRLRLTPQIFEKNLVEKLGSRFVPIRGESGNTDISRYRLPTREGTDIQLVINQQQGVVSTTGSPAMVESSLQIVRLLDVPEVPGGAITRFMPVQQSNIAPVQRVANMVNRETVRVAQAERPAVPAVRGGAVKVS